MEERCERNSPTSAKEKGILCGRPGPSGRP